jgi:hypothetical protein
MMMLSTVLVVMQNHRYVVVAMVVSAVAQALMTLCPPEVWDHGRWQHRASAMAWAISLPGFVVSHEVRSHVLVGMSPVQAEHRAASSAALIPGSPLPAWWAAAPKANMAACLPQCQALPRTSSMPWNTPMLLHKR